METLEEAINYYSQLFNQEKIIIDESFINTPSWVVMACLSRSRVRNSVRFSNQQVQDYGSLIGFSEIVSGEQTYFKSRPKLGKTYSNLVELKKDENADYVSGIINSCIKDFFKNSQSDPLFTAELCDVIGELHDNVCSHSCSSSFSQVQKKGQTLTFAIADTGLGFLKEINRIKEITPKLENDEDAIQWCIQKGNSTKKIEHRDEFTQKVPSDMMQNPFPKSVSLKTKNNHHLGLGLFKLTELIKKFRGELSLASGQSLLFLSRNGTMSYKKLKENWSGVAICADFTLKNPSQSYNIHNSKSSEKTEIELF